MNTDCNSPLAGTPARLMHTPELDRRHAAAEARLKAATGLTIEILVIRAHADPADARTGLWWQPRHHPGYDGQSAELEAFDDWFLCEREQEYPTVESAADAYVTAWTEWRALGRPVTRPWAATAEASW